MDRSCSMRPSSALAHHVAAGTSPRGVRCCTAQTTAAAACVVHGVTGLSTWQAGTWQQRTNVSIYPWHGQVLVALVAARVAAEQPDWPHVDAGNADPAA
jgi:hypothetical protein